MPFAIMRPMLEPGCCTPRPGRLSPASPIAVFRNIERRQPTPYTKTPSSSNALISSSLIPKMLFRIYSVSAPKQGADTEYILKSILGMSDEEIKALDEEGVLV